MSELHLSEVTFKMVNGDTIDIDMSKPGYEWELDSGTVTVYPILDIYKDMDLICLSFGYKTDTGLKIFRVTVNCGWLPYLYSAINTCNSDDKLVKFLERNGFGYGSGMSVNDYMVFAFNEDKLREIDADLMDKYKEEYVEYIWE